MQCYIVPSVLILLMTLPSQKRSHFQVHVYLCLFSNIFIERKRCIIYSALLFFTLFFQNFMIYLQTQKKREQKKERKTECIKEVNNWERKVLWDYEMHGKKNGCFLNDKENSVEMQITWLFHANRFGHLSPHSPPI